MKTENSKLKTQNCGTPGGISAVARQLRHAIARAQALLHRLAFLEPRPKNQDPNLRSIITIVARAFGVNPQSIYSRSRLQPIALARQVCMALARDKLNLPFRLIGRHFRRSARTAWHASRLTRDLCATNPIFRREYEYCAARADRVFHNQK